MLVEQGFRAGQALSLLDPDLLQIQELGLTLVLFIYPFLQIKKNRPLFAQLLVPFLLVNSDQNFTSKKSLCLECYNV